MAKTEMVIEMYAQNLHHAERRRAAQVVSTHWKFLDPQDREDYMALARDIHSALYLGGGDVTAAAAHMVTHFGEGGLEGAQDRWERIVTEAQRG